jgi:hypothetical protein
VRWTLSARDACRVAWNQQLSDANEYVAVQYVRETATMSGRATVNNG